MCVQNIKHKCSVSGSHRYGNGRRQTFAPGGKQRSAHRHFHLSPVGVRRRLARRTTATARFLPTTIKGGAGKFN